MLNKYNMALLKEKNMTSLAFLIGKVENIGGVPRVVSLLTDSLIKTGLYKIHIISYLKGNNAGYAWNDKIDFHYLMEKPIPMQKGIFASIIKARKILSENNVDILISCGSLFGPLGILATRFTKVKTIYWDHSNFFENTSHKFKVESKKFTSYFVDAVVPLTKHDKINYEKHTKAKLVFQIYNPIDTRLENLNHSYDLLSKKIISVGRLTDQKNFLQLVDIAKIVLNEYPDWSWDIYGSGPHKQKIIEKIDKNNLSNLLFLKGQSNDLYSLYKDYSFMVMTSIYEGFPMILLEGVANKLPLISFDIQTGPNEIIIHNENGFLIKPFHVNEMASRIIELIKNETMRLNFSKNNENYGNSFNMKTITKQWVTLIERIN